MSEKESGEPVDPQDQNAAEEQPADDAAEAAGAESAPEPAAESENDMAAAAESAAPDAEAALNAVEDAVADIAGDAAGEPAPKGNGAHPMDLPDLTENGALADSAGGMDLLSDVNLDVKIELGRTLMYVEDVLKLAQGAVVELDKLAGDPVDVYVNDRHVARGEVLILNDNFCVRINEILHAISQD